MSGSDSWQDRLFARASQARQQGQLEEARTLLEELVSVNPAHALALNSLGLMALEVGDVDRATDLLGRAVDADPTALAVWLNLSEAHRSRGDTSSEMRVLDKALSLDPYCLPALFGKAQLYERVGEIAESARIYKVLISIVPDAASLSPSTRTALGHAEKVVRADSERRASALAERLAPVKEAFPDADWGRADSYAEQLAGRRKVFNQQPTGGHFPYLPAFEFFDRSYFPWFEKLEAATEAICEELLSLWAEEAEGFAPYVAFDPTAPVNQWAELNHSARWSAWFLYKDGLRQQENCARCPKTAEVLEDLPLLDIPGKAPSVMFSVLEPRTRIPPHTGTTNVRATVHLPLVVPDNCGFRVGAQTRQWRKGEAWAFDDTIEHEAWNESDRRRAVLILDVWNPLLTEAEQAAVRATG